MTSRRSTCRLRLPRWLVALLCALQLFAGHGVHARSAPETDGHLFCGTPTLAGISMLADLVPAEHAKALRQLTGAGDDCDAHCATAAVSVPSRAPTQAFGRAPGVRLRIAAAAVPPAGRHNPLKPPSTAPPARA